MLLLSAAIVWRLDQTERGTRHDAIMYASRAILSSVDAQLGKYIAVLDVLGASPTLQPGDLAVFRQVAERSLPGLSGSWVVLADTRGQQVINTLVSAREPLPRLAPEALADEARAFETEQTQFSDVIIGPVAKVPVIAVGVPVFRAGEPAYYLMIGVDVTVFLDLLNSQGIPGGWLAELVDRSGNFIVRSRDHERWVGKPVSPSWHAVMNQKGLFDVHSVEGELYTITSLVSPLSGWTVGVGAQKAVFEAPIRQTVIGASIVGLLVTLLSVLLATLAAWRITRPISVLEMGAQALRRHEPVAFQPTRVPEIDDALQALSTTSTALIAHEKDLRDSEERLRAVVDTAVDAIVVIDEHGIVQSVNPAIERMFGYQASEVVGNNVSMLMPEPDRTAHDSHIEAYRRTGRARIIGIGREVEARRKDGTTFPVDLAVAEWRMEGQRFFTGIMRDITQRKHAEEHVRFVMRELSHRTKNILAVVQTMAWKTARTSVDLTDFEERFVSRIQALACSHDLLIQREWQGVRLEDLVLGQLHLFGAEKHLDAHGPDLMLRPEAAQSLGLALHELATNASKYGALTHPAGRIDVAWSIDPEDAASRQFRMCWRESGGPEVSPPKRNGFGYTVVKEMAGRALKGEVALEFIPEGLVWQLTAPATACLTSQK